MINNDYYFLCLEKDCNHHSWIIQYSVFNKNFQRIYGHKVNNSLAIQLCINIPSISHIWRSLYGKQHPRSVSSGYQNTYSAKFHKTSLNGCLQRNVRKRIL